jgi:hypothetical protein
MLVISASHTSGGELNSPTRPARCFDASSMQAPSPRSTTMSVLKRVSATATSRSPIRKLDGTRLCQR